jgi:hypothetical protein
MAKFSFANRILKVENIVLFEQEDDANILTKIILVAVPSYLFTIPTQKFDK